MAGVAPEDAVVGSVLFASEGGRRGLGGGALNLLVESRSVEGVVFDRALVPSNIENN